jgi:hypothetical protein
MKTYRLLLVLMAALVLGLGSHAYAASPREDLVQAYVMLRAANNNYNGHRGAALRALEDAGQHLGLDMKSKGTQRQPQMSSDARLAEAGRILRDVRYRLDRHDRDIAAAHVDRAIREIDEALRISSRRY